MDIDDFRADFLNQVAVCAAADSDFTHSAFVQVALEHLEEAGEVADFQASYFRGLVSRHAVAIDGYSFDKADGSLRVFLADPGLSALETLTQTSARALFGRLRAFVEDAFSGLLEDAIDDNSPARAAADDLKDFAPTVSRIRAYLLTDALLSLRVKDWPEEQLRNVPVEFHIWDINRFFRAFSSRTGQDELLVDFASAAPPGIPCLDASSVDSPYAAYLCVIPGSTLADIYDQYGSRLLEGNVRSFLSTRGRINSGIRRTVLTEPSMFFAYNNGIAATASAVEIVRGPDGAFITTARDLQIVNGGQTTASLAAARRMDKGDLQATYVPMKLSVIDPTASGEMIPRISRFANSQNAVSQADFFSNHEFHRQLERLSRRLWAPARPGSQHETRWFYERARGQYLNATVEMTLAERRRFVEMNPREQVITKTDLAKAENSWGQLPHIVSRGAQSSFLYFAGTITDQWNKARDDFHEEYFRLAAARVILFRTTEHVVSRQPWYSGGYRANIVTYAIARLSHEISRAAIGALNFRSVWQQQRLSDVLCDQLALTAEAIYAVITNPVAGRQNVTQWCKREECWLSVKAAAAPLLPAFMAELVPPTEVRAHDRTARMQQQMDSGIDAQTLVVQIGNEYWSQLLSWCRTRRFVTAEEERMLRIAAGHSTGLPNEKQSKRLLQLVERCKNEGFLEGGERA